MHHIITIWKGASHYNLVSNLAHFSQLHILLKFANFPNILSPFFNTLDIWLLNILPTFDGILHKVTSIVCIISKR